MQTQISNKFTVKLYFYGVFRQYISNEHIDILLNEQCMLSDFKQIVYKHIKLYCKSFNDSQLIQVSAFASDKEILNDTDLISADCCLSILPPVCGG